jgi:hypothetical protein
MIRCHRRFDPQRRAATAPTRISKNFSVTALAWRLGCALLIGAGACCAGPITYLQLQEQVSSSPGPAINPGCCAVFDSGILNQTFLTQQIAGSGSGGVGLANGSIDGSQIRGFVSATSTLSAPFGGGADLTATWVDTITLVGLAPGTPVSLLITDSLHSVIGLGGAVPTGNYATAFSTLSLVFPGSLSNPRLSVHNTDLNPVSNPQTASLMLSCISGSVCFTLTETLALTAHATLQGMAASVDARNTNDISIDVLTPGAGVSAASGVSYSASTPEPGTGGLLLLGAAGTLVLRRWRERSARG